MPGRSFSSPTGYRYGFNGMESDYEIKNSGGTSYTAEYWEYDSRLGRRWNVDPVNKPWQSCYSAFANNPIFFVDPEGNNEWHPEDDGSGKGTQKLVADEGDLDANTGKVDQDKLKDYLKQTVGDKNYTTEQFDSWISSAECDYASSDCHSSSVSLTSANGQFDNLVGKYLANKAQSDPSWGVTNYKGDNCSPTTFNRVDQSIEFVYGKDYLGKLSTSNPIYNAWQGNSTSGYSSAELYGPGVANKAGFGTLLTKDDIIAGTMKTGAIISLDQRPGLNGQSVSWHAAIFLNYNYDAQGGITGFNYWHHWTYHSGTLKNAYQETSTFNFNNGGKYTSKGYKPMTGLNFR
jgi:hypothetical protein